MKNKLTFKDYLHNPDLLVPAFLWRFWHNQIMHPIDTYQIWRKWRLRPSVGDYVVDCRYQRHKVIDISDGGDTLILDDGSNCSWMHCCDYPE